MLVVYTLTTARSVRNYLQIVLNHELSILDNHNLVAALLLCTLLTLAKPVQLKGQVYSPYDGVICDKKGGFCADSEGISVALTKMHLGEKSGEATDGHDQARAGWANTTTRLTAHTPRHCSASELATNAHGMTQWFPSGLTESNQVETAA